MGVRVYMCVAMRVRVRMYAHVRACACLQTCVCASVRACVHPCVRVCVCGVRGCHVNSLLITEHCNTITERFHVLSSLLYQATLNTSTTHSHSAHATHN